MVTDNKVDPEDVLQSWRTKILNGFLVVAAGIATIMTVATMVDARSSPGLWPAVFVYVFLSLVVVGLAVFREIDYRIRVWGILVICYIAGLATMATFGLGSAGRLYMLAVPIITLILIGVRPGMTMSIVSILTIIAFAILAGRGVLGEFLVRDRNSLVLADWLAEFADTLGILSVVMVLLILFYRFQEDIIARERSTQAELIQAQKLLEEQNATLEQKVQERTSELQASNHSLEQRNAALAILNSVSEAMTKTLDVKTVIRLVGEKIREIFDVDSSMIMLLDKQTNLIQVPYRYDRNEGGHIDDVEPIPLGTSLSSRVIITGKPLLAGTIEEIDSGAYFPPGMIKKDAGSYSQSWLGVPILSSDRVLGLIALADNRPHMFNRNHMRLLQTLSSNLGAAIENARLFEAEQDRIAELQVINEVQMTLAAKMDIQAIYELIGEKVAEVFSVDVVDIVSYDPNTHMISMPYSCEKGDRSVITPRPPYGFRLQVINSRKPLLINQNFKELAAQYNNPILTGEWPKSVLFVPFLVDGQVRSILSIQDLEKENAFKESDVHLLETLASSMSIALENARLFDETGRLLKETEQHNRELSIINNIQQGLASKIDQQAIIDLFGDELSRIYPPQERKANKYSVYIALYDPLTEMIQFPYMIDGAGERFNEPTTPLGPGLTSAIIRSGQPLLLNTQEEQVAHGVINFTQIDEPIGSQSWLGVPIRSGDQIIGVISMQDQRPNLFTESDVRILSTLAASLAVALENARLFGEVQQRAAELGTVNMVSSAITSELDLDALIQLVGEQIRSIFKTDIAYVALLDRESNTINFPYQYGQHLEPLQFGEGLTSQVIQSGAPLLINEDLERQREQLGTTLVGRRALSYLGVPIFVEGEAIGVVSVQSTIQEGIFSENDQHLLSTIASNVGIALQNARLFEEIRQQEQLARESQRRLADIIEFLPDAALVVDREGKVTAWNHAMEEMTGIPARDMLGRGNYEYALPFYGERRPILIDLVHLPEDEIEKKYAHIHRTGGILTGEAHTPFLKGESHYLYATASALYDAQNDFVGAIEIIRDITDRKQTEEELVKARASAEQANHAKSAFLANMSHELRTPLNAIIGFTRIVRRKAEGVLPEKQTENLDKVLMSADHLLNLINTVLDIAKIEAGRMDVLAANFRIAALIDLCANTAQPLLKPHVILEKQVDKNLTYVHSDQDKLRQIVLNLLSNAAKFTHQGKIVLSARQDGDDLRISVRDTGIGIRADALPRLFKEFQQADSSTTRQYGGTGLGLSISRNLAQLLGGDLLVESELGKGSTFTLVTPLRYGARGTASRLEPFDQAQGRPAPVPAPVLQPGPGSAKKRVLVIDDDPDAVYLLQENLNQQEYEIIGARNGQDGLRLARESQPQAILLDIIMPGLDGWQVLHDLKANPVTTSIPVVFLTILDKKALGLQLGAAAYLLKPLDPAEVRETLDRVIGGKARPQKHVLVVDDDPHIADMLRQLLPESEFYLESALDGVAGLEMIEKKRPDILLLDLIMPRLDGFGVIERVRANPQTQDLPIVVLSAKELAAAESACLKETVAAVMKKQGFEGEKLVDEINHAMGNPPHKQTPDMR